MLVEDRSRFANELLEGQRLVLFSSDSSLHSYCHGIQVFFQQRNLRIHFSIGHATRAERLATYDDESTRSSVLEIEDLDGIGH